MATKGCKTTEGPRSRHARRRGSGFFWFVTGAVVGAFGVGLAWTLQSQTPPPPATGPQIQAKPAVKPRFVFHQLLPEMEVLVSDEELHKATQLPAGTLPRQQPAAPPKLRKAVEKPERSAGGGASYLVQVASLRKASDAERVKARLALLGIQANIQRVTVNGKDYHRVRAGPYQGKQEVNKTRALLSSNGLEAIAIRLK